MSVEQNVELELELESEDEEVSEDDELDLESDEDDGEIKDESPTSEEEEEISNETDSPETPTEPETDDELVVNLNGEDEESDDNTAPRWVKELRKTSKQHAKENRELRKKLDELSKSNSQEPNVEVGNKPTLDDFDFDTEKFETQLLAWHSRKSQADAQKQRAEAEQKQLVDAHQQKLQTYVAKRDELAVEDFEDAEATVMEHLNPTQQAMILELNNPALFVYAVSRNEAKLKQLASINNPVKFAFEIAQTEGKIKVSGTKKTSTPAPEKRVKKSSAGGSAFERNLDKLRTEAEKTGDYTKVIKYKQDKQT